MRQPHPRLVTGPEPLEDRATPATLRIVPLPGGITGFGTAGTDPNAPSAQNSELVPAEQLAVPFGPRELGAVTTPVQASSTLSISNAAPAGLFPTLGGQQPAGGALVFDVASVARKGGGLSGGGTTAYTYGLDPNVILAPITLEVVASPGEQAGQPVTLSFGFTGAASPAGTNVSVVRQDAGFTVGGGRTSLFSRNLESGQASAPLAGGQDVTVRVGDTIGLEFTQAATLAGIGSGEASARLTLGVAAGRAAGATDGAGVGAVGAGAGGAPVVEAFGPDGFPTLRRAAFDDAATGGVRVAAADVTGDGVPDVVAGTGPGRAAEVRVFDGVTGAEVARFQPFEAAFLGGVFVAAGDVTGDGRADVVVTPDEGGGPVVVAYDGTNLAAGNGAQALRFFGIEDPDFRGGARATVGDVTGDGTGDLVVAAGFGGGPRVSVWDGTSRQGEALTRHPVGDFFVFEQTLRNGVYVAAGDLNGDGFAEVIAGGGPGGGPRVFALSGRDLIQSGGATQTVVANFFAGDTSARGGVRVAARDLNADGRPDLLAASGARVAAYPGQSIPPQGTPAAFREFDSVLATADGVYVG